MIAVFKLLEHSNQATMLIGPLSYVTIKRSCGDLARQLLQF